MVLTLLLFMLPILTSCSNDGNIHLLEEDIAAALRTCNVNDRANQTLKRLRRTSENIYQDPSPRIDVKSKQEMNQYNHERRRTSYNKMNALNRSNFEYSDSETGSGEKNYVYKVPKHTMGSAIGSAIGSAHTNTSNNNYANSTRTKRNEPLINKDDNECLSQCVFANLQVVDLRGIPREAELWNKVQSSVTSHQSRTLLRDQIHACFQQLQSESEDNGCYYSNKLEKCLMLRFSDRKINATRSI